MVGVVLGGSSGEFEAVASMRASGVTLTAATGLAAGVTFALVEQDIWEIVVEGENGRGSGLVFSSLADRSGFDPVPSTYDTFFATFNSDNKS